MAPRLFSPLATLATRVTLAFACMLSAQAAPLPVEQQALHVLNRIAYGPRPGDIDAVAAMGVQRYIALQLEPASLSYAPELTARLAALDVPNRPAGKVLEEFIEVRKEVRDEEEGARQRRRESIAAITLQTAEARVLRAIDSPRQLEEVMVDFWFNHFNVFFDKGEVRALVASYERDAIRPYVFGNFRDMLGATAKHPAMLYYLDNHLSAAGLALPANAAAAAPAMSAAMMAQPPLRKRGGVNENYARELMELHTLGVNGGYSQKDVTELARMLTGWTYDRRALIRDNETFRFDLRRHDRGPKLWMGRQIGDQGQAEGEYALDVLANHPATARHLSTKLAQYFVQDVPPAALVERMARTWLDTSGDIRAVLRTLLTSEQFLGSASVGAKFKTPYQFVISAARASATPAVNIAPLLGAMRQLGMPLHGCQTPDGYKNTESAWLNPDALSRRIGFASALADGRLPQTPARLDAGQLGVTLGSGISARTQGVVAASSQNLRAALLLGSPDFMQR